MASLLYKLRGIENWPLPEWDAAASLRDREKLIAMLRRVGLSGQADGIADGVLSDPKRYGF